MRIRTAAVLVCLTAGSLAGCSGSSSSSTRATTTPLPSDTVELKVHPTASASPTLPVASAYVVKTQKGVTYAEMQEAFRKLSKIAGLRGLNLTRGTGLRVDLAVPDDPAQRRQVLAILTALGKVDVAF
ncbi:MAG: hypothetical protein JWO22_2690 [Frankiales bacterium]|nr:hypothetical protein [Frankiales bacterium]